MKWFKGIAVVLLLAILTACGNTETKAPEKKTEKIEVKDATGNTITLEEAPTKIVSLMPSNTEILFALDLGDKVKGVTAYDDYPKEAQKVEKVTSTSVDTEKIIAIKPDLVLGHESMLATEKDAYQLLKDAGINVFVVPDATDLKAAEKSIITVGKLTGKEKEAKEVTDSMEEQKVAIEKKAKELKTSPKVWIEISPDLYTAGKGTFMNEMLELAGGTNVVTESGFIPYNEEKVVELQPDIILSVYPDAKATIQKRAAWKDIPAVKNDKIYEMDANKLSRPGPRLLEGAADIQAVLGN
ncbi:ABC transporter substrate-binding protein [Listeria monocytogenes]|uniref:ABC transporter substrate-binding protein n=2 Tax=Listeria monocytogenes TaxID=1639 RepID=A0A468U6G8_LISMN|nr:ABC transporter substrate-binding protein [Listeria monocytogenes]EAF4456837.1 ABC transporter substrate-binding protein [Listeria monocytogenes serotype 1/2a]EEP3928916.1 ABC transporter substrate-binding protein [Listeria monocytogenes serotype 4ab]MCY60925.1 ABC transporter substrate-binding protein [Listeria monocytogenes serotype 4c]MDA20325.1 ABC transporter substrate-binding protein [Listeria monocytogenes serotype 4a]ACK39901.1 ABC transporter, substrate-binding protein [Listeria mo